MADEQQQNNQQQQQQAPWHQGVEAETLGFWQNKGLPLDDPKAFAAKLTEQYRGLEKHIGAPADRIIRLPDKPDDAAGWNSVYSRLGVPAEAKEYDFSGIKHADGKDVDPAITDALRTALLGARVPKDRGADVVKAVVQTLDARSSADSTVYASKLAEEKAALEKSWGVNKDYNHLKAMEGARRAGADPEAVAALEKVVGYAKVMELFRKIGQGTSEDAFVEGGRGPNGNPTTREGAISKKADLMNDPAWGERYVKGDAQARQEMDALNFMIDGEARAA